MRKYFLTIVAPLLVAAPVFGHGDQVQITYNPATGKIETREIVHTASRPNTISDLKRVYVMPFLSLTGGAGDGWYTRPNDERNVFNLPLYPTGPGINFQYDEAAQLPGTGWSFSGSGSLPNLQGSNFGYIFADGLKEWTGASFADPGPEQVQIFRGDGTSVPSIMSNTTDAGPFATMNLSTIASKSSNAHSSVGYRLLGDGTSFGLAGPAAGDDGVYLLTLQLISTAAGVGASDPFYYVMYKNRDVTEALTAAADLGFDPSLVQLVPEPSSLMLFVVGAAAIAVRRRR
jgi:hypothetical protein